MCIVEVANNLPTTATNRILPAKDQGCVPPPPPPLLIHRAVSIIHFVTLISCESFHVKLKSGISGLAPGTRFDLIYAEAVCC